MNLIGKKLIVKKTKEKGICINNDEYIDLQMENGGTKKFKHDAIDEGFLIFDNQNDQDEYTGIIFLKAKGTEVLNYLEDNYGFEGFFHETNINNLKSIIESGFLYSRRYLENSKIKFVDLANQEVLSTSDSKKISDYCRLYFHYGTPTCYRFNQKNQYMVYILFDWELLYEYSDKVEISDGNQASKYSDRMSINDFFDKYNYRMDWNSIFDRTPILEEDSQKKMEIIRKRNAEVCIKQRISTKYIKKIIFKSDNIREKFIQILDNDSLYNELKDKMEVDIQYYM